MENLMGLGYIGGYYSMSGMIFLLPVLILASIAQHKVKANYNKYKQMPTISGLSGYEVAQQILSRNQVYDVKIEETRGVLTDHFDPRKNVLRLSPEVYRGRSVSSASIAAHEVGHALQYAQGYAPIKLRNAIVPMANIGSQSLMVLIIAGMIFNMTMLIDLGIIFFSFAVAFHIVTLPVEFNASKRAMVELQAYGMIRDEEVFGAKKVLNSAAMTYVASTATAIAQLIRLVVLRGNMSRD